MNTFANIPTDVQLKFVFQISSKELHISSYNQHTSIFSNIKSGTNGFLIFINEGTKSGF